MVFDEDHEGPSEADLERFGGDTASCPSCGAEVWDGATICPGCGMIADEISGGRGRGAWVTIGLIVGGLAFLLVFVL